MSIFKSFFEKVAGKKPATPPPPPAPEPTPAPAPAAPPPPAVRDVSQIGVELIKSFEGCELKAYPDPATGGDPWTIGYGHTGPEVVKGLTVTKAEAEAILKKDLKKFVDGVLAGCKLPPSQPQLDAMVSLAFNIGVTAFQKSTLLKMYNAGDSVGAAAQFLRWDKAAGKQMKGLTRRRTAEKDVFEKGIYDIEELRREIAKIMLS